MFRKIVLSIFIGLIILTSTVFCAGASMEVISTDPASPAVLEAGWVDDLIAKKSSGKKGKACDEHAKNVSIVVLPIKDVFMSDERIGLAFVIANHGLKPFYIPKGRFEGYGAYSAEDKRGSLPSSGIPMLDPLSPPPHYYMKKDDKKIFVTPVTEIKPGSVIVKIMPDVLKHFDTGSVDGFCILDIHWLDILCKPEIIIREDTKERLWIDPSKKHDKCRFNLKPVKIEIRSDEKFKQKRNAYYAVYERKLAALEQRYKMIAKENVHKAALLSNAVSELKEKLATSESQIKTLAKLYEELKNSSEKTTKELGEAEFFIKLIEKRQTERELCYRVIKRFPDHAEFCKVSNIYGKIFRRNGELDKAIDFYRYVSKNSSDSNLAIKGLAMTACCEVELDNESEAEKAIDTLKKDYSGHKELCTEIFKIADEYFAQKKYVKAKALYQYVFQNSSDRILAGKGLGWVAVCESKLGNDSAGDQVIDALLTIYRSSEDFADNVNGIADSYRKHGFHEKNIKLYQGAFDRVSDKKQRLIFLAAITQSYFRLGDDIKAKDLLDRIYADFAGHRELGKALLKVYHSASKRPNETEQEVLKNSLSMLQRIMKACTGDKYAGKALVEMSICHSKLGDKANAEAAIDQLIKDAKDIPDFIQTAYLASEHYFGAKNYEFAKKLALAAIEHTKDPKDFYHAGSSAFVVAKCARKLEDLATQIKYCLLIMEKYPKSLYAYRVPNELGALYRREKNFERAVYWYKQQRKLYDDRLMASRSTFDLGVTYARMIKDDAKAVEVFENYLKCNPSRSGTGVIPIFLATCYDNLGKKTEAIAVLNRALENCIYKSYAIRYRELLKKIEAGAKDVVKPVVIVDENTKGTKELEVVEPGQKLFESIFELAEEHYDSKRFDKAKELFQYLSDSSSVSEIAVKGHRWAVYCEIMQGNKIAADEAFEAFWTKHGSAESFIVHAMGVARQYVNHHECRDLDRALKILDRLLKKFDGHEEAIRLLKIKADAYVKMDKIEQADAMVDEMLGKYPVNKYLPEILNRIAYNYLRHGYHKRSNKLYHKMLESNCDKEHQALAHSGIGRCAVWLRDYTLADAKLDLLLKEYKGNEKLGFGVYVIGEEYYRLGKKTYLKDRQQGKAYFDKAIAIWQHNIYEIPDKQHVGFACYTAGFAYVTMRDNKKAKEHFEMVIEKSPGFYQAWNAQHHITLALDRMYRNKEMSLEEVKPLILESCEKFRKNYPNCMISGAWKKYFEKYSNL